MEENSKKPSLIVYDEAPSKVAPKLMEEGDFLKEVIKKTVDPLQASVSVVQSTIAKLKKAESIEAVDKIMADFEGQFADEPEPPSIIMPGSGIIV